MKADNLLLQAMVYLAAGVISVPIAKRLGLGSVLGYLVAGVLVGPFLLNLVGQPGDVMRFAEFGVVILLFLIGLEVRPALLWAMRKSIFGLGGGQLVATTALAAGAGMALGLEARVAIAAGLILAMSSTAIVLQNLDEKGLRHGAVGEASFGVLLFQDLAVIPLFALLPLLAPSGHVAAAQAAGAAHQAGGQANMLMDGLPDWGKALAQMAAVAAVVGGGRYLTRPLFRFIAAARLREIFTASALLLVVAVAVLMELVGLSPALGAFLAGVVLAESEFRRELETDIEPFRGLLLGLFFITVGAGLDLGVVAARPLQLFGLVLGLMILKGVAMFFVARGFGLARRPASTTAVALAQGGEFAFVLIGFVAGAHVMSAELAKLMTAVVALSMALTPLAFAAYERLILNRTEDLEEPEDIPFDQGDPDAIVAGFGRFGQIAARILTANDFNVVTLDSSIEQIDLLRRFGWRVHYGDASRLDLLRTAGADKAKLLIIAIDDKDKAVEMVEAAAQAFPNLSIVARAYDRRHAYELMAKGCKDIERETFEAAVAVSRRALMKLGFSERRATRAAGLFRDHDKALFLKLAPLAGQDDQFALATRDARETMEKLLSAEMALVSDDGDDASDEAIAARRAAAAARRDEAFKKVKSAQKALAQKTADQKAPLQKASGPKARGPEGEKRQGAGVESPMTKDSALPAAIAPVSFKDFTGDFQGFSQALGASFQRYGFAVIADHGLAQQKLDAAIADTKAFFALPDEVKRRYKLPVSGQRGYTPFGVETAKGETHYDLKEFWHVGRDLPPGHPYRATMPDNVWPDADVPGFHEHLAWLYAALDDMGRKVLEAIATYLGLERRFFDPTVDLGNSILRLLHYPPVPEDGPHIRAAAHEDINVITLLLGAEEAGLEVKDNDGRWIAINPPPGSLVCNIGDMLQRLTNHRLPSTSHRVVNPAPERRGVPRYSTPFFLHFNSDYEIRTLPSCVDAAHPDRYPQSITADDFLQERLREIKLA